MMMNPYEALGVKPKATSTTIKAAYRKLCHEHHPDKGGDPERFREITLAYRVLSDEGRRQKYDRTGTIDNESAMNFQALVNGYLAAVFGQLVSNGKAFDEHHSFIKIMRDNGRNDIRQIAGDERMVTQNLDKLAGLKKRISRKDEAPNVFVGVIDQRVGQLRDAQKKMQEKGKVVNAALDELEQYDCIEDVVRAIGFFANIGTSNTTSTGTW